MFDQYRDVIESAIITFGVEHQLNKAAEELNELLAELEAEERMNFKMIDEIADVQIMLWQLMIMFGLRESEKRIAFKMKRLEKLVETDIFDCCQRKHGCVCPFSKKDLEEEEDEDNSDDDVDIE